MSTAIPTEYQIYNSYEIDPIYQLKFTIAWTSLTAFFVVLSLPLLLRNLKQGKARDALLGVWEGWEGNASLRALARDGKPGRIGSVGNKGFKGLGRRVESVMSFFRSFAMFTIPALRIDIGQLILILAYFVLLLTCLTVNSELVTNPNRAGFLTIAHLPLIFTLSLKSSPLSFLLPGVGYEKLNILHRWVGRGMFIGAVVHGGLWIRNHLQYGLQILGSQKETSGVAAFALMGVIVVSSLRPVRALCYQAFFVVHILAVVSFFVVLCYHTIYAAPYIYPPLALYAFDLFFRMVRSRVKDATLIPIDRQFTIIRVENTQGGWTAGQHVRLRTFIGARMFESHPMTILNSPLEHSCLPASSHTLLLGCRSLGDWSRALNEYARVCAEKPRMLSSSSSVAAAEGEGCKEKEMGMGMEDGTVEITNEIMYENLDRSKANAVSKGQSQGLPTTKKTKIVPLPSMSQWSPLSPSSLPSAGINVMLDGPYGGHALDLLNSSHVLLVAGGSGITFACGVLDELVGTLLSGVGSPASVSDDGFVGKARKVDLVWCIRSFGAMAWAAPVLSTIAERVYAHNVSHAQTGEGRRIELRIKVYVTCLCSPEDVPPIRGCTVSVEKPDVGTAIRDLLFTSSFEKGEELDGEVTKSTAMTTTKETETETDSSSSSSSVSDVDLEAKGATSTKMSSSGVGSGNGDEWERISVLAAGPESMIREARNAAARLALREGLGLRRGRVVECHTEVYNF